MPARSNDFQAIVYFIKKNLAPDATVKESAQLPDRVTGEPREVDVLVSGHIAGQPLQVGIECRERSRKDSVSWVEEMRAKHDDLPTDSLVLVSKSGFSKAAVSKARHYRIELVTPGKPIADDGPLAGLRRTQVEFRDVTYKRLVSVHGTLNIDGRQHTTELTPDHVMFASDGTRLGPLAELLKSTFNTADLRTGVAKAVDGDQYLIFDVTQPRLPRAAADPIQVYLRRECDPPVLVPLLGLRIVCAGRVDVRPVELTAGELQGDAFAYGSGRVAGVNALLVLTQVGDRGHLSVRLTDATGVTSDWNADPDTQELIPHTPPE